MAKLTYAQAIRKVIQEEMRTISSLRTSTILRRGAQLAGMAKARFGGTRPLSAM